jgi:hypothetical protein
MQILYLPIHTFNSSNRKRLRLAPYQIKRRHHHHSPSSRHVDQARQATSWLSHSNHAIVSATNNEQLLHTVGINETETDLLVNIRIGITNSSD